MRRTTFIRKLKALGEIPVPKGHHRTRKGITTYFFAHSKLTTVLRYVSEAVMHPAKRISEDCEYVRVMEPVTLAIRNIDEQRTVLTHIGDDFVSVWIAKWHP